MTSPYLIEGPALISFSGGRTSAYMLHQILDAHGGALPPDVHVTFANTGKEREETLRFVHEIAVRWGVPVVWLEWRGGERGSVVIVTSATASRAGEPFDELIASKQALPNWQARWCTAFLKVRAMHGYMRQLELEPGEYVEAIGLRADELGRVGDMVERSEKTGRRCTAPLARAGVTKRDVMAFWAAQEFDLGLRDGEGNCDLCFLKGRSLKKALIADRPQIAAQWHGWEQGVGATFDRRDSVAKLAGEVRGQGDLWGAATAEDFDVECGLVCGADT